MPKEWKSVEKPWVYHGEMESLGKSHGQNPCGLRPLGFWPWDFPRDSIHHDTPSAFPQIVPRLGLVLFLQVLLDPFVSSDTWLILDQFVLDLVLVFKEVQWKQKPPITCVTYLVDTLYTLGFNTCSNSTNANFCNMTNANFCWLAGMAGAAV